MRKKIVVFMIACLLVAGLLYAADAEMVIRDGAGGTKYSQVNSDNQLVVNAVVQSELAYASSKGDAYSWSAATANIDATDTALCVINNSKSRKLVIDSLYVWTDVPTALFVHCPATATWAGTAVTGTNLNRTSTNAADALAYRDETGNTQANVIVTLQTNETTTDEFAIQYDFKGAVILGYNNAIAVDITAESAALNVTIIGHFID